MSVKKVVVFIDWFTPAVKAGGPVRSVINITQLLGNEIKFYIVCGDRDLGDTQPYPNITLNTWVTTPTAQVMYLSATQRTAKNYKLLLHQIAPDSVYINGLFSFQFSILPLWVAKKLKCKKIIIAPRGMLGNGALELKALKKKLFLLLFNTLGKYTNVHWHATANEEKLEIQKRIAHPNTISIISNITTAPAVVSVAHKNENELRLLFISRISLKKNLAQAIAIVQKLIAQHIAVTLDIYGPVEDVAHWTELQKNITASTHITYQGILQPHQFNNTFNKYHALLFPTMHENYGHVIAEALSYGLPVVLSDQTPWRNLAVKKAGFDIALNNNDEFLNCITQLYVMNNNEFNQWQQGAQLLYAQAINNEKLKKEYLQLFN